MNGLADLAAADVLLRGLLLLASAVAMEGVAALVHRHWMHGPGWGWHRSHHQPDGGRLERNDRYALVFAALAIVLFVLGQGRWWPLWWIAAGMSLYGLAYALLHDGLVHRRWPMRWTPRRGYLAHLVQAHRLHHAVRARDGAVSFGFLYAPSPARLAADLRARRRGEPATPDDASARRRQGRIGVGLALLIAGAWLATQAYTLGVHRWAPIDALRTPLLVAWLCWLNVGLFIVAHDAIHGSLLPGHRGLNRGLGRVCLWLYAGFSLSRLERGHHAHHRSPGTPEDPDFHPDDNRFWPWYGRFLRHYLGLREAVGLVLIAAVLWGIAGVPVSRLLVFWALPAVLSSLQLFAFGTWLPHRRGDGALDARHRARSNGYGALASLASCFHFGYHLEHHRRPDVPWWRLPALRRGSADAAQPTRFTDAAASTTGRATATASSAAGPGSRPH